jgi:hypothetical protein
VDLRALRLNCLLAPLLPTVLALGALGFLALREAESQARIDLAEAQAQVEAWANGPEPTHFLTAAGPRWTSVGILRLTTDRVAPDPGSRGPLPQEPSPELVQVVHGPQAWRQEDRIAVAVRLGGAQDDGRILYAERLARAWNPTDALLIGTLLLVGGGLLGGYLARRIYRPVEWLTAEAQAALDGRPSPTNPAVSAETETLNSSISQLAEHYRSSRHG